MLLRTLKACADVSRFEDSPEKTTIYFGDVKEEEQNNILQITSYKKGYFPFR